MGPQSKKNHVKHGKYGSIMPPHIFPWKPQFLGLTFGDKRTTPPRPEIYPQNLSTQYLVVCGSKKQQRRGWDYSNFTKEETFSVSLKLSAIRENLTLHYSFLPLPKKTSHVENIRGHLFEKLFLVCFSPLSPQAEQKEDDEHFFANHLQI